MSIFGARVGQPNDDAASETERARTRERNREKKLKPKHQKPKTKTKMQASAFSHPNVFSKFDLSMDGRMDGWMDMFVCANTGRFAYTEHSDSSSLRFRISKNKTAIYPTIGVLFSMQLTTRT